MQEEWEEYGTSMKRAYAAKFGGANKGFDQEVDQHISMMQNLRPGYTREIAEDWLKRMAKFTEMNKVAMPAPFVPLELKNLYVTQKGYDASKGEGKSVIKLTFQPGRYTLLNLVARQAQGGAGTQGLYERILNNPSLYHRELNDFDLIERNHGDERAILREAVERDIQALLRKGLLSTEPQIVLRKPQQSSIMQQEKPKPITDRKTLLEERKMSISKRNFPRISRGR